MRWQEVSSLLVTGLSGSQIDWETADESLHQCTAAGLSLCLRCDWDLPHLEKLHHGLGPQALGVVKARQLQVDDLDAIPRQPAN